VKIEEVPFVNQEEVDAKALAEEERLLNEMEQMILDEVPSSINKAIDEFAEYPKDPVPIKKKKEVSNIRKISKGANTDIRKLFRDAILTRKAPAPQIPVVPPDEPKKPSFIERKFGAVPVDPPKKEELPKGEIPKEEPKSVQSDDINPFQMNLNPPVQDYIIPDPIIKTRSKPLPPVVMPPRQTFWQRIMSIKIFKKLNRKAKSKISSKRRDISTGMTARQRIKRYNSIHEGGYGAPKDDESTKTS
jgi:hypothetical protein